MKAEEEEGIEAWRGYLSILPIKSRRLKHADIPEVLIEEELGQNPESGEGWTEYNFQASTASLN